ncbi:E3 ubiquitin ligase [Paramarasmius palmivorus]|uniref:E3 ubiquitin ligase n=1 Tax=Paramarasmius palmivorus TaxID=297713 RepID=A0AAW0DN47_9AGAR
MPTATMEQISGPSTSVLVPSNSSKKRQQSEDISDVPRDNKRLKVDSPHTNKDKKKRRKKKRKMSIVGEENYARSKSESSLQGTRSVSIKPASTRETESAPVEDVGDNQLPATPGADASAPNTSSSESSAAVNRLTDEVKTQSSLIDRHEKALAGVQQNISCQICLDLLYKPYALAPCGHVACHSCLVSWFTSPQPHDGAIEDAHQPRTFYTRKKTCPHCRAIVRERPVEVWAIKNIVTALAQSGLLTNIPEPLPPPSESAAENKDKDPWKNIFRPPTKLLDQMYSNDRPLTDLPVEDVGMYDAEDGGIYRCLDCMHEIEGGVCSGCERLYPGHEQLEDHGPFWDELIGFWGGPPDIDDSESDGSSVHGPYRGINFAEQLRAAFGLGGPSDDEDEEGEGEEEDYEGSFIDDGDVGEVIEINDDEDEDEPARLPRRRRIRPTEVIELSDEESDHTDDGEGDHSFQVRPYGRGRLYQSDSEDEDGERVEDNGDINIQIGAEDEDSQHSDSDSGTSIRRYHRSRRIGSDESEDEEEDDGSIPGPPARYRHWFTRAEDDGDSGSESD